MWIELEKDIKPLNKSYQIKDEFGNIGFAQPTYYPFKLVGGNGRKWSKDVVSCESYWDGGWLINCRGKLTTNITGKITHFREYKNKTLTL